VRFGLGLGLGLGLGFEGVCHLVAGEHRVEQLNSSPTPGLAYARPTLGGNY
jgi:hypothetical protein